MNTINLLKSYDKNKHLEITSNSNIEKINLHYLFSEKWNQEENIPYIVQTHLLDSYYCLPERPDMAFTFLWKSINSSYNELYITKKPNEEKRLSDTIAIEMLNSMIVDNFDSKINDEITVELLLKKYISKIPLKLTKFISNYLLKNYVLEKKYSTKRHVKYISSSFNTFKSKFPKIYNAIIDTYGSAYEKITNPEIDNHGNISLNIKKEDEQKSREITHSLAITIKELLIKRQVNIDNSATESFTLDLTNNLDYIKFITLNLVYAIRNNTIHGKIASRLNSKTKNKESYFSSVYLYLLGYMILSISLYELDYINATDLEVNLKNFNDNIDID